MPDRKFRMRAYDVELDDAGQPNFEWAIDRVLRRRRPQRFKSISDRPRRLEDSSSQNGYYLLNLSTFHYQGPGQAGRNTPLRPIGLAPDDYFAYQTAMLYDPANRLALIEASRLGMSAGAIAKYFGTFEAPHHAYYFLPRLDQGASARVRQFRQVRKVEIGVSAGPVGRHDRDHGLELIHAVRQNFEGEKIRLTVASARARRGRLSLRSVRNLISSARQDDSYEKVKVYGRINDDDKVEAVDLLGHQEVREVMLPVDPASRQTDHRLRWTRLLDFRADLLR